MAFWLSLLTLLATVQTVQTAQTVQAPEVVAPAGHLQGIEEVVGTQAVRAFRGIPYAEAPVKGLRWRPPVALKPWQGVRDASKYGNMCMQFLGGNEDCLYLNVYTPSENVTSLSSLPCLVWIHGGGFEFGSGGEALYNGTKLVSFLHSQGTPAVLVTMNYRMNVFGFLGSELLRDRDPQRSTGNYGIQDQRMALRWVQDNIAAFGGDPEKVMIFGQSAGACSVSSHLLMPGSWGNLYSSAVMDSGGFSAWSAQPMSISEEWFQRLLNYTRCSDVECLTELSAKELISAYMAIPNGRCCSQLIAYPFLPWAPTIDGVELTAHPMDLVKEKKVKTVPMLLGSMLDDAGPYFSNHSLSNEDLESLFEKYGSSSAAKPYLSESHASFDNYTDAWWASERAVTDQNFFCPNHFASRSLVTSTPVFQFVLAHSLTGRPIVMHGEELPFVFMNLPAHASAEEKQLSEQMAMSWYHMAASGSPSASDLAWPKQTVEEAPMMKFQVASKGGNEVKDSNYRDEQCSFMLQWLNKAIHETIPSNPGSQSSWPLILAISLAVLAAFLFGFLWTFFRKRHGRSAASGSEMRTLHGHQDQA